MKKTTKWILTAVICIGMGALICVGALALAGFDLSQLGTTSYTTNSYDISDAFSSISIDTELSNITLTPSEDDVCRVVCIDEEGAAHIVEVRDSTLYIKQEDTRPWYKRIGIRFQSSAVTVYLPQRLYESLSIQSTTGNACVQGLRDTPADGVEGEENGFTFDTVSISVTTGNVSCELSTHILQIESATGKIGISNCYAITVTATATTGNIELSNALVDGAVTLRTTTGNIRMQNCHSSALTAECTTGNIRLQNVLAVLSLTATTTTGNILLDGCDAKALTLTTTAGNVKGTLQSGKIFTVHTDTGRINIPESSGINTCKITTDTGNITIEIE